MRARVLCIRNDQMSVQSISCGNAHRHNAYCNNAKRTKNLKMQALPVKRSSAKIDFPLSDRRAIGKGDWSSQGHWLEDIRRLSRSEVGGNIAEHHRQIGW
jgi:hypothetical protein